MPPLVPAKKLASVPQLERLIWKHILYQYCDSILFVMNHHHQLLHHNTTERSKLSHMQKVDLSFIRSKMEFGSLSGIYCCCAYPSCKAGSCTKGCWKAMWVHFSNSHRQERSCSFLPSVQAARWRVCGARGVEPLQKFAPEFKADSEVEVKTRLQHKTESNKREELKPKQNQHRDFSLNKYKWSWQGQGASVFNRILADIKANAGRGTKGSWLKIKSVGNQL